MDRISFEYSTKNIPTAPRPMYLKRLIEKSELFMKRIRWKAYFYLNPKASESDNGFHTSKTPRRLANLKNLKTVWPT